MYKIVFTFIISILITNELVFSQNQIYGWGANYSGQLGFSNAEPWQTLKGNDWRTVASGYEHSVAIKTDGTLWAWGSGYLGNGSWASHSSPIQIGDNDDWELVTCGEYITLAIKTDGSLWAWGLNVNGQLGDGTQIDKEIPTQIDSSNNWLNVSCGNHHVIAIKTDGTLWTWGTNEGGQLGDSTYLDKFTPTQITTSKDWLYVAAGEYHSIALKTDGTLWAWGTKCIMNNSECDLISLIPTQIDTSKNWFAISCGLRHTLAIKNDGSLWGWGNNGSGQLGDGSLSYKLNLINIDSSKDWSSISCGHFFSVAIKTDGTLWTWGNNESGQLGDFTKINKNSPIKIGFSNDWSSISCGWDQSLAIKSDGSIWAWGSNSGGMLGDEIHPSKIKPTKISTSVDWSSISCGYEHTVAIKKDGTLWAWGNNQYGQLGDSSTTNKLTPTKIGSSNDWISVSCGFYHTIALKTDGTLWAWGNNQLGQLGDNSSTNRLVPTKVNLSNDWAKITCGSHHNLALKKDGSLWAWGANWIGQLGDNTLSNRLSPIRIGLTSDWSKISCGYDHSLAIKNDSTLWAWGDNWKGQLGDSTGVYKLIPTKIGSNNDWQNITCGSYHSLASKTDSTLWAWGNNLHGQLGDSSTIDKLFPIQVNKSNDWSYIECGWEFSFAVKRTGTLWAWGNNKLSQLGDGTTTDRIFPIKIGISSDWASVSCGKDFSIGLINSNFKIDSLKKFQRERDLKFVFSFSNKLNENEDYSKFVSLSLNKDTLINIKKYIINNNILEILFSLPTKSGEYTLKINSDISDNYGNYLDQNNDNIQGDSSDIYIHKFYFKTDGLKIIKQFPKSGTFGEKGETELNVNNKLDSNYLNLNNIYVNSPSSKELKIIKICISDENDFHNIKVEFDTLKEDGVYSLILHDLKSIYGDTLNMPFEGLIDTPFANLVPDSTIFVDSLNWEAGIKQKIKIKIKNIGNKKIEGNWSDVVYYSTVPYLDKNAKEIFRHNVFRSVDSNSYYETESLINVPIILSDSIYLIIKTNLGNSIREYDYTNNTVVSNQVIKLKVPEIEINEPDIFFTLNRGEKRIYKLVLDEGKNVKIYDSIGVGNISLGLDVKPNEYSYKKNKVDINNSISGNYYILLSNDELNPLIEQNFSLSAKEFELEIVNIFVDTLIKNNLAIVPIEVIGCSDMPEFELISSDNKIIKQIDLKVFNETLFYVYFQTNEMDKGYYDLNVRSAGDFGFKSNAIFVDTLDVIDSLQTILSVPSALRPGMNGIIVIEYSNKGNVDIPCPLLILKGTNGVTFWLDNGIEYKNEIHLMGLNQSGVVNRLAPGDKSKIFVNFKMPNGEVLIDLRKFVQNSEGMNSPFYLSWIKVDSINKPISYINNEWLDYISKIRSITGYNWNSFIFGLSNLVNETNVVSHDARIYYELIKEKASLQIDTLVSGKIKKEKRNEKLQNALNYEPGTLFIWNSGQWKELVSYDKSTKKWNIDEMAKLNYNPNKPSYFVGHGWNDNIEGDAAKKMAIALSQTNSCNVFTIDWSKWSNRNDYVWKGFIIGGPFGAFLGAAYSPIAAGNSIPKAAKIAVHNLYRVVNNKISDESEQSKYLFLPDFYNNFHLIGHSHGAHLCGLIASAMVNPPKRITALDASEEVSHLNFSNWLGSGWNRSSAQFVDYYKSSVISGNEQLKGHNNFILIEKDDGFNFINNYNELQRHGYAVDWYIATIYYTSGLGFSWNKDSYKNLTNDVTASNYDVWTGVIRGGVKGVKDSSVDASKAVVECLNIRDTLQISKNKWNYPDDWYSKNDKTFWGSSSEWNFRDGLSKTCEFDVKQEIEVNEDNYIYLKTNNEINLELRNRADNFTIPKSIREKSIRENVVHSIYLSKLTNTEIDFNDTTDFFVGNIDIENTYIEASGKKDGLFSKVQSNVHFQENLWNLLGGDIASSEDTLGRKYLESNLKIVCGLDKKLPIKDNKFNFWIGELSDSTKNNFVLQRFKIYKSPIWCNIGSDRELVDNDSNGYESLNINAIAESTEGTISNYTWFVNGSKIKSGMEVNFSFDFKIGKNKVKLVVTDDKGNKADDNAIIEVGTKEPEGDNGGNKGTSIIRSYDPNEKIGSRGFGGKDCLKPSDKIIYSVYFENDPKMANAPAQIVRIEDYLDPAFDLTTFSFHKLNFVNTTIDIPENLAEYSTIIDLRPSYNYLVKADLKLEFEIRKITVLLTTLDPETEEFITDPWGGFLYQNDSTHRGEGYFSYSVKLRSDLTDSVSINNKAEIYFDYNDPIITNVTKHLIDLKQPKSWVNQLPNKTNDSIIVISWNGIDDGSGIANFDIYISKDNANFEIWRNNVTAFQDTLYGEFGSTYYFYSIAKDSIGLIENSKSVAEASIKFETLTKTHLINLTSGWNLISSHIQPQVPDSMNNVLDDVAGNMLIAKDIAGAVYIPAFDINTIGKWDVTKGYQLYMSQVDTLTVTGIEVIPSETPIQLSAGWNMISYLRNSEISAELAFASITDNENLLIAKTLEGLVYIPSFQINTIGNMKPGVGYRVYVTTSDTLVYPEN